MIEVTLSVLAALVAFVPFGDLAVLGAPVAWLAGTVLRIRRAQVESTEQHELFKSALARSTDRFGTVSEFFGRGVMAAPPLVD